jgi:Raf kinase inhibitor-like YbhB/YbcL family protein
MIALLASALVLAACRSRPAPSTSESASTQGNTNTGSTIMATTTKTSALTLSSSAFSSGGEIPRDHTCEGSDRSPALEWSGAPQGTQSFALIVDDPDAPDPSAPKMVWVHWVLYDIPATSNALPDGAKMETLPRGAKAGMNDFKKTDWGGPCPPVGRHRYFFKLYALDVPQLSIQQPDKKRLEDAMKGHVLAQTELMGTYQKAR